MSQNHDEILTLDFNLDLIKRYPRSNRRLNLAISPYGLADKEESEPTGTSVHISPHGIEFRSEESYPEGTLLKIHIALPDYWNRKQRFVEYSRIDTPERFKILAKVVSSENLGKRGKKALVVCKTVNMDDVDEQVLKAFLQEG